MRFDVDAIDEVLSHIILTFMAIKEVDFFACPALRTARNHYLLESLLLSIQQKVSAADFWIQRHKAGIIGSAM
jgi:hypothetical protein